METASFSGVIRTLFYIILFYYILKFVVRLLLPVMLKKAVEKAEENLRGNGARQTHGPGETYYEPPTVSKPRETRKVGEYVDFEEIE